MSRRPAKANEWVPLRIESWRKNTRKLSAEERGCYMDLLLEYWETQAPLEYNEVDFANICNVSVERWREIEPRILRYFDEKDGFLYNRRMDEEMQKANDLLEHRRKSGRKGGLKSGETRSKKEASASALLDKKDEKESKRCSRGAATRNTRAGIGADPEGERRSVRPLDIENDDKEFDKLATQIEKKARRSMAAKSAANSESSKKMKGAA